MRIAEVTMTLGRWSAFWPVAQGIVSTHQEPRINMRNKRPFVTFLDQGSLAVVVTRTTRYIMARLQTIFPISYPRQNMTVSMQRERCPDQSHVASMGEQWNRVTSKHEIYHVMHKHKMACFNFLISSTGWIRQQRQASDALAPTWAVSNMSWATYSSWRVRQEDASCHLVDIPYLANFD